MKRILLQSLQLSSPMSRVEAKRTVKLLMSRQTPLMIQLIDGQHADGMAQQLLSIGAQVDVVDLKDHTNIENSVHGV